MPKTFSGRFIATALLALSVLAFARVGDAHHAVLRVNLEELTTSADRIFLGRCVSVVESEEEIAQGILPVTTYTFDVERAVKGKLAHRITIRQLGHHAGLTVAKKGDITSHGEVVRPDEFIHGMSSYEVGDRVVLFLNPDHLDAKVTSPVGLYQGAFYVSQMPSGAALVRNRVNNLDLFTAPYTGTTMKAEDARVLFPEANDPMPSYAKGAELARKRGALPLDSFLELVDQINTAHGGDKGVIAQ